MSTTIDTYDFLDRIEKESARKVKTKANPPEEVRTLEDSVILDMIRVIVAGKKAGYAEVAVFDASLDVNLPVVNEEDGGTLSINKLLRFSRPSATWLGGKAKAVFRFLERARCKPTLKTVTYSGNYPYGTPIVMIMVAIKNLEPADLL